MWRTYVFRGNKGLYIVGKDGKLYFPDRSVKDKVFIGFIENVKVVKDCGTYGFFVGDMVKDATFSIDLAAELIKDRSDSDIKWICYENVDGLAVRDGEEWVLYCGDEEFCRVPSVAVIRAERYFSGFYLIPSNKLLQAARILNGYTVLAEDELMPLIASVYRVGECESVRVFGGGVVVLKMNHYRQRVCGMVDGYWESVIIGSDLYQMLKELYVNVFSGGSEQIKNEDLINWAKENMVAFGEYVSCFDISKGTVKILLKFKEYTYALEMFGGSCFYKRCLDDLDTAERVRGSVDGLKRWLAMIGRYGRSAAPEISRVMSEIKGFRGY